MTPTKKETFALMRVRLDALIAPDYAARAPEWPSTYALRLWNILSDLEQDLLRSFYDGHKFTREATAHRALTRLARERIRAQDDPRIAGR